MKRIGIIGGGQLGKMMLLEGKKAGFNFIILDPDINCPAASIADEHIIANFYDEAAIKQLADKSDVITYEFEHIDAEILVRLEEKGHQVHPSANTLKMIQNKLCQKNFLNNNNIPIPAFQAINSEKEIYDSIDQFGLPLILKTCTGGYDGKGNYMIKSVEDIPKAYKALGREENQLMVEAFIDFEKEISIIVAMGKAEEKKVYPIGENIHEDSILRTTIVPARVTADVEEEARKTAINVVELFNSIGIFCIEMFVDRENNIFVNEIAPRPHNSGHYTIEGCSISQFYQHLRAISNLPLGEVQLIKPSVMINLLGQEGYEGRAKLIGLEEVLEIPEAEVHFYGKKITMPQRKMGHVTVLGETIESALGKAERIKDMIKVISEEVEYE